MCDCRRNSIGQHLWRAERGCGHCLVSSQAGCTTPHLPHDDTLHFGPCFPPFPSACPQACGTGVNLQVMPTSAPRPAHPARRAEGADGSGQLGMDGSASTLSLCQVRPLCLLC